MAVVKPKISIITPTYNSERYIQETVTSVQQQTEENWEMIIVDDCSTDNSVAIVEEIATKDSRVKCYVLERNQGAARARNKGLEVAQGRFITYLDSDDLWLTNKLKHQVDFMERQGCAFSCTSYGVIDEFGKLLNKEIYMLPKVNYKGFLMNNLLQTVGIMVDISIVDKKHLVMPDMRRRQDAATWLHILKAGYDCYGIDEVLALYRRTPGSLSGDKKKAVKGMWVLYREVEGLSLWFSAYCFLRYAMLAVWKRIHRR